MAEFYITNSIYRFYNACRMTHYDLCTVWNWEYDRDFVGMLETACARIGLSFYSVTDENLDATLEGLSSKKISFGSFFDRACESDVRFQSLVDFVRQSHVFRINPQELTVWSQDKATMHMEFVSRRLDTPYTILLSSFNDQPGLPWLDLAPLGGRFAIKPASLGGGEGVVLEATSQEQVSFVRTAVPTREIPAAGPRDPPHAGEPTGVVPRAGLQRWHLPLLVGSAYPRLCTRDRGATFPLRLAQLI